MTVSEPCAGSSEKLARTGRASADQQELQLDGGWELARVAPDAAQSPVELAEMQPAFRPAIVPGTVAQVDAEPAASAQQDAWDHWYRHRFAKPRSQFTRAVLCCDGLATLAEVWLNGRLIARSSNMFERHAIDVTALLVGDNELCIRFRALAPVLRERRPRGRWPTRLVSERNLRFVRTTLIGYMPGFCPPLRPVGPWRAVRLVLENELTIEHVRMIATIDGTRGVLQARIACRMPAAVTPAGAELVAGNPGAAARLEVERVDEGRWVLRGELALENVQPWWPHTHGEPRLHDARVVVAIGARTVAIDLGKIGFRKVERPAGGGFALRVNGQSVYCRGACWTPLDVSTLHVGEDAYRTALQQVRGAGINMLRLSGNLSYESDTFYRLCDELGILVWQDFMFANMDYPTSDPEFMASCRAEASQWLERTSGRACVAVLCGNSEVAQQAAMMGLPRDAWHDELFAGLLPELCAQERPDVPYVPSSPSGGVMPFHTGDGPTHYYGVGAYLRPIDDARLRPIGFASECLAFSNVPEDESLHAWLGDEAVPAHHPRYKARVPRDPGAGWDFADVTDHYVELLFGVDARRLRYSDHDRYLQLCRVATGEVMARVQGLWRRSDSGCHGAIVWLLRDLSEGAGFGLIDSRGVPKAAYYYLKRAWAPRALWIVDEGTDGMQLRAANDGPDALTARLELTLHRADGGIVEGVERDVEVAPRGQLAFSVEDLIGRFVDSSYAYRFGPPVHTLVAARLLGQATAGPPPVLARAFHLPLGLAHDAQPELAITATARASADGSYALDISATRFAQSVSVQVPGYTPSDNYFHLAPGETHRVTLAPAANAGALRGKVRALNAVKSAAIQIAAPSARAQEQP